METSHDEIEPSEQEYQLGEWFFPFQNYSATPYISQPENAPYKIFPVTIVGLEKLRIGIDKGLRPEFEGNALLQLPNEERIFDIANRQQIEEQLETDIVDINVSTERADPTPRSFPYACELRYHDEFENNFEERETPSTSLSGWRRKGESEGYYLFFPETDYVLGNIAMRIVEATPESSS